MFITEPPESDGEITTVPSLSLLLQYTFLLHKPSFKDLLAQIKPLLFTLPLPKARAHFFRV